jgi:hypothetical protein
MHDSQQGSTAKEECVNLSHLTSMSRNASDLLTEQLKFMHGNVRSHALDLLESTASTDPASFTTASELDSLESWMAAMQRPPCWQGSSGGQLTC